MKTLLLLAFALCCRSACAQRLQWTYTYELPQGATSAVFNSLTADALGGAVLVVHAYASGIPQSDEVIWLSPKGKTRNLESFPAFAEAPEVIRIAPSYFYLRMGLGIRRYFLDRGKVKLAVFTTDGDFIETGLPLEDPNGFFIRTVVGDTFTIKRYRH